MSATPPSAPPPVGRRAGARAGRSSRSRAAPARGAVALVAAAAVATLAGCDDSGPSGGERPPDDDPRGVNGTYLHVSTPRFYFGTREVGTQQTDTVEIQNRGADAYPLTAIELSGEDLDDFRIPFYGEVVLQPAQAIRVPVTFAPLAEGRKYASLEVDYDTIVQVEESVNVAEQAYYRGVDQARAGDYARARETWAGYIESDPVTVNERRAAVRMPVAKEADRYDEGVDATLYLEALDARDREAPEEALVALERLLERHGDGYLADDARYLRGYVLLMDMDEPAAALDEFAALAERHPQSSYRDTALYAEAIARERLGEDRIAAELYTELLDRHTAAELLGVRVAKDSIESRLWFARAERALETLGGAS